MSCVSGRPQADGGTKGFIKLCIRKECLMIERYLQSKEDQRKDIDQNFSNPYYMVSRTVSDRRESILHYELLNYAKPDSRSGADRRSEKEKDLNQFIS